MSRSRKEVCKPDDPEQSKAFIKKAREVGANEEKSEAGALLGQLRSKPPEHKPIKEKKQPKAGSLS